MSTPADPVAIEFAAADFFLLRSPALPIDQLIALGDSSESRSDGSSAPGATDRLNNALQAWIRDPFVQAAIYLASPSLSERLTDWLRQPSAAVFEELRPALFRYFVRMTSRATPFGLFASISLGRFGEGDLKIGPRENLRRRTWLDLGYVYPLVAQAIGNPEARMALSYLPNSTLFRADDGWRYVEETITKEQRRRNLVRVESSDILDVVLASAEESPTFDFLVRVVLAQAPDAEHADVVEYLEQLIESQMLLPTLAPTLTGKDPLEYLVGMSAQYPGLAQFHGELKQVSESLQKIDAENVDSLRDAYKATAPGLLGMLASAEEKHLFHVDLRREAPQLGMPASVPGQVLRAVELLRRTTPAPWPVAPLAEFRRHFMERYGDRDVPLMEVLDEDTGIGFDIDTGSRSNEHLLAEFKFGRRVDAPKPAPEERRTRRMIDLLENAWSKRQTQIRLSDSDVDELAVEKVATLPDIFTAFGCLAPSRILHDEAGLNDEAGDDPCFVLQFVSSGAGLFGRLCRSDAELKKQIKALHQREEALQPDAIFAELVHLPDDRVGNVVCRPALRNKDLPCLGHSGLDRADQIKVSDLTVAIESERIVLRSRESGREVLPRLTSAHNIAGPNASVYRFLAALSKQDGVSGLEFGWGQFADARFLPRVVFGNVVLSPASWRVEKSVLASWLSSTSEARQKAIGEWRTREGIPRWIQVGRGDNLLSLDLDNPWCAEALAEDLRRSRVDRVSELFPSPEHSLLRSPDGRHAHEVMIPFVRTAPVQSRSKTAPLRKGHEVRRFTPGSRWLYAKLYGSPLATEAALTSELLPLVEKWRTDGSIDRWHFVRYRDNDDHLRVRFHGAPDALSREVQPTLQAMFQHIGHGSAIWKCQLDTYERETTRYGGPEAIDLAEQIFDVDSEAIAALLRAAPAGAASDWRWQLSIMFVDSYYEEFGLDLAGRERLAKSIEADFRREFQVDSEFERQISQCFRKEKPMLEALFAARERFPSQLRWAQGIVDAFKEKLAPHAAEFRSLARRGRLSTSLLPISASLAHMHVNRMMMSNPREHELIIHALLHRICRGRIARGKVSQVLAG